MAEPGSKLVNTLLDRLYATLESGPLMSCRPHSSRQRVDLCQLSRLKGPLPNEMLSALLGQGRSVKFVAADDGRSRASTDVAEPNDEQRGLIAKLRTIAEDARTYEEDTGTQALFVGFPILSLPPQPNAGRFRTTKRIMSPLALVPLRIAIKSIRTPAVELEAAGDGADLVIPNAALLAWVERITGKDIGELFADEEGVDPWRELNEIVVAVTRALELPAAPILSSESAIGAIPRSSDEEGLAAGILMSAVIGLFPAANQGLLRDLQALCEGEPAVGPIESFLKAGMDLGAHRDVSPGPIAGATTSVAGSERCISPVDPCQARAVHLARKVKGLVIHGPPGTGKSQTITNIIGDHLANGERVLFVCDKRTALDVVAYRLNHLGLGSLCAVVHDVRRDQRELYKSIREQLDALPETHGYPASVSDLYKVDAEITRIHGELSEHDRAISEQPNGIELSFHELVGHWLPLKPPHELAESIDLSGVSLSDLMPLETTVREILERGLKESYATNPLVGAVRVDLPTFLSTSHQQWESRLKKVVEAAERVDGLTLVGAPAFDHGGDILREGQARRLLGELAKAALAASSPERLAHWLMLDPAAARSSSTELNDVTSYVDVMTQAEDRELSLTAGNAISVAELNPWIGRLRSYLQIARLWYSFLFFGRKRIARRILERFGAALDAASADRVTRFLERIRARRVVEGVIGELTEGDCNSCSNAELVRVVEEHLAIFRVVSTLETPGLLDSCRAELRRALTNIPEQIQCVRNLCASEGRASAIAQFEAVLASAGLLTDITQSNLTLSARHGKSVGGVTKKWLEHLPSVDGLLRIETLLADLNPKVATLVRRLVETGTEPDDAWKSVQGLTYHAEIKRRLQIQPALLTTDGDRVQTSHQRYRALAATRRSLSCDAARHVWISRQRERLLASTGSRLNTAGAEVRRRLVMRGERAMRVRQMIGAGAQIDGGDPLFDLRPVWMASPDVVAQIFPREPLFDVVIFDEASQCRLEEGLPVLLRARRVVIAGDPQQLPPTRFFQSAVVQNKEQDAEDQQGLFEAQQGDVEDLLGAALNLSVEQAYLDVHYRSSNADLIEFSNRNFYESRLQPIPSHPKNRTSLPPLRLIHVDGEYDKRTNLDEAREVVKIVKQLLSQQPSPSIGIACFNLTQRDQIVEALDRAAAEDRNFCELLSEARVRQGQASFEGLFVRNLENVQGDERDHIIISTTFGPDPQGRFYRRFGPLGQAGGGRRLNVLVTRARQMVHLVTSIPKAAYQSLAEVPVGAKPNGAWLLFAYLAYAEQLAADYRDISEQAITARAQSEVFCSINESKYPSPLAAAIGNHLKELQGISSWVHWGNDGFTVDAALVHPDRIDDVTIGVLCDGSRFLKAADRVQWDMFRTEVLEGQGWRFIRLWSPQIFRDPEGAIVAIKRKMNEWLAEEAAAKRAVEQKRTAEIRSLN